MPPEHPTLSRSLVLLLGLALAVLLASKLAAGVADPDLFGYLCFGREFWQHGFPFRDLFAYTPVLPRWIYHEWLTGVVFYQIFTRLGGAGIVAVKYLAMGAAGLFLYLAARRRGTDRALCLLGLLPFVMAAGMVASSTRAQVLTVLFFCLTLFLLEHVRHTGRIGALWWLVPVNVVWANFHGGFLVGDVLIGIYAVSWPLPRRTKLRAAAVVGLILVSSLINPYGLDYWTYLVMAIGKHRVYVPEWASALSALATGRHRDIAVFTLVLTGLLAVGFLARKNKSLLESLLLVAFAYAGLSHVRHAIFLACLAAVLLPPCLERPVAALSGQLGASGRRLFLLTALAACLALTLGAAGRLAASSRLALVVPGRLEAEAQGLGMYYPTRALAALAKTRPRANILCHFPWGQYISWRYAPRFKVGMDGRYETIYPAWYEAQYFDFLYGKGDWTKAVTAYGADVVLLPHDVAAAKNMATLPGWRLDREDEDCVVFVKEGTEKMGGEASGGQRALPFGNP